jgi:hypothetical protein
MDFINIYIREARLIVFNTTFNNITVISWRSVLLRKETGENHQPARSHWQTKLTRWVQLVAQELQILPEHPSTPPTFSGDRVFRSLVFMCMFCRLLFVLFLFATLLPVLRFTDSDYPFSIFKLFFKRTWDRKNKQTNRNICLCLMSSYLIIILHQ